MCWLAFCTHWIVAFLNLRCFDFGWLFVCWFCLGLFITGLFCLLLWCLTVFSYGCSIVSLMCLVCLNSLFGCFCFVCFFTLMLGLLCLIVVTLVLLFFSGYYYSLCVLIDLCLNLSVTYIDVVYLSMWDYFGLTLYVCCTCFWFALPWNVLLCCLDLLFDCLFRVFDVVGDSGFCLLFDEFGFVLLCFLLGLPDLVCTLDVCCLFCFDCFSLTFNVWLLV